MAPVARGRRRHRRCVTGVPRYRYATMNTLLEPRVRRATSADAAVLAELRFAFRASLLTPVESSSDFLARCAPWMAGRLRDESRWRAWLLEADDAPVGMIWLQIIEKLPNPGIERELHGYVTSFYVASDMRGRGFGSRLLAALIAECHALGVDNLFLWPTAQSRVLYERHGFSVADSIMVRVL
jgi:GNAT superfamily N-acetyltransferase